MRLSPLQRSILKTAWLAGKKKSPVSTFRQFYAGRKKKPSAKIVASNITRSIERLIDRELMVGHGRMTSEKWFIDEVRLTPRGRRAAKALFGVQLHLPFKK